MRKKRRAPSPPKNVAPFRPLEEPPPAIEQALAQKPTRLELPLEGGHISNSDGPAATLVAPEGVKVRRRAKRIQNQSNGKRNLKFFNMYLRIYF